LGAALQAPGTCVFKSDERDWTFGVDGAGVSLDVHQYPPGFYVVTGSGDSAAVILAVVEPALRQMSWQYVTWDQLFSDASDAHTNWTQVELEREWNSSSGSAASALIARAAEVCAVSPVNAF